MDITNDIKYVGVNDHAIDLFEGQYIVENGMAYNSYVILDDKIAIIDTVDARFFKKWLFNIKNIIGDKKPDYLIIEHMEPDHSANILKFMNIYNDTKIVSSSKAFVMMKNFFGTNFKDNQVIVNDGDILSLGKHSLKFISAPMVHWPEVMMIYDIYDKTFFSSDAFGKFGALDINEEWTCEARRYYFGIVGKFGAQVQLLLKKVSLLDIKIICPLHGPILNNNLSYYLNLYDTWSSYKAETEGVFLAYNSIYGNTKDVVLLLEKKLKEKGINVVSKDLAREDIYEAVEDAFRYSKLVLASPTYNSDIFPYMKEFINHLIDRNYSSRTLAFIENGSWAPVATKVMKSMFEKSKNIKYLNNNITIMSSMNEETILQIDNLVDELCNE